MGQEPVGLDLSELLEKRGNELLWLAGAVDGLVGFSAVGWAREREVLGVLMEEVRDRQEALREYGDQGDVCADGWRTLGRGPGVVESLLKALPPRARRAVVSNVSSIRAFHRSRPEAAATGDGSGSERTRA